MLLVKIDMGMGIAVETTVAYSCGNWDKAMVIPLRQGEFAVYL